MLRTFSQHVTRMVESLDGPWDFITADERSEKASLPENYTRKLNVPSAWESVPGLETYRGTAWYRRVVPAIEGLALRLVFGGVSHTATVFVDGEQVGSHYDAFTPFEVVVTGLDEGPHEVVVEVDNSFGDHSALHIENDYYTYGGITRPVEIQWVPPVYIRRMQATPHRTGKTWSLDVAVELVNTTGKKRAGRLALHMDEAATDQDVQLKPSGVTVAAHRFEKLSVDPWTAETPNLYELWSTFADNDGGEDDLVDRIGFRQVDVKGKKLLLNDQPLTLRGYNRHEDHPTFGCALPVEMMAYDLELMADQHCNFVRTCHYPNDMRFLDLCDEMGFYVWEESHARTVDFKHPRFREQIAQSTTEMVQWHGNRPSIIMWGCLNECESETKPGAAEHKRVIDLLRKLDPSRPITFASNRWTRDLCLGLVDIVSFNYYIGWYGGTPRETEKALDDLLSWLHSDESHGGKGKPVIMSEFGGGAIYGVRDTNGSKWSEQYQAELLDEALRVYLNHPDIVGTAIWQFCDVRITQGWMWDRRPRTMNNKGTVDEYRRKKLAYDVVKRRHAEAEQS